MVLASRAFSTASSRSKQSLDNKSHLQNNQKHASAFAPGVLLFFSGENVPEGYNYFGLKSEKDEKGEAKAGRIYANVLSIGSHFAGYELPAMLTKKREEI